MIAARRRERSLSDQITLEKLRYRSGHVQSTFFKFIALWICSCVVMLSRLSFLKTHEQRLPFVRIDPIGVAVEKNIRMKVDARDAHFESDDLPA